MIELWKDIQGYEGMYQASTLGFVRGLHRTRKGKSGTECQLKGRVLVYSKNNRGYLFVILCKNATTKGHLVHRLVAGAFLSNPSSLAEVNHMDFNKENNNISNLEWCSRQDNRRHFIDGKGFPDVSVYTNNRKVRQLDYDGNVIKVFDSIKSVSKAGFQRSHVRKCCNKLRKSHAGFQWEFSYR